MKMAESGRRGRLIVVEPLIFLYSAASLPLDAIRSQFLYQKVQEHLNITLVHNTTGHGNCDINTSDVEYLLREKVQAEASQWTMYLSLLQVLPSFFVTLLLGIYSDRAGRKVVMLLPPIGSLLSILIDMMIITFDLPIYFLFLETIEYCMGGRQALVAVVFAYISDTSSTEYKDIRMTLVDIIWLLTSAIADFGIGYLIKSHGFISCLYILAFLQVFALAYAIFLVPEVIPTQPKVTLTHHDTHTSNGLTCPVSDTGDDATPEVQSSSVKSSKSLSWDHLKSGLLLYIQDNGTGRRWLLNVLFISYILEYMIHGSKMVNLFVMNSPLCWESVTIGYYGAVENTIRCIGGLVFALLLRRCLTSESITVVARIQTVIEYTYMAFVSTTVMMFLAPVLGCMNYLATPMTRVVMSNLVEPYEQGALFAIMSSVTYVFNLFSSVAVNKIYQGTLFFMPGFIFLVKAGLAGISAIFVGLYIWRTRRRPGCGKPTRTEDADTAALL